VNNKHDERLKNMIRHGTYEQSETDDKYSYTKSTTELKHFSGKSRLTSCPINKHFTGVIKVFQLDTILIYLYIYVLSLYL